MDSQDKYFPSLHEFLFSITYSYIICMSSNTFWARNSTKIFKKHQKFALYIHKSYSLSDIKKIISAFRGYKEYRGKLREKGSTIWGYKEYMNKSRYFEHDSHLNFLNNIKNMHSKSIKAIYHYIFNKRSNTLKGYKEYNHKLKERQ